MNKTLLNIIKSREDISDYLVHFTTGKYAFGTLKKIIESGAIIDINGRGCICFSETPITLLTNMFNLFTVYPNPIYAPYGIAIRKKLLYNLGARPVIYGSLDEEEILPDALRWRFEQYIPDIKDFSWLREWRLKEKEIKLDAEDCFIITDKKKELEGILFDEDNIVEVEFDGCVSDGQYWGSATAILGRTFKGVSFEDIFALNRLSKTELDKLIESQSLEDKKTAQSLGGFLM